MERMRDALLERASVSIAETAPDHTGKPHCKISVRSARPMLQGGKSQGGERHRHRVSKRSVEASHGGVDGDRVRALLVLGALALIQACKGP